VGANEFDGQNSEDVLFMARWNPVLNKWYYFMFQRVGLMRPLYPDDLMLYQYGLENVFWELCM
jgi:hypothetical protein